MLYTVFPLALILTFLLLLGVFYRGPSRINEVFAEGRRPAALRRTVNLWFGVMLAVFILAQVLRIPFLEYVIGKLAHPARLFSNWHDLAHTAGLVVLITAEIIVIWQWLHYLIQCRRGIAKYRIPDVPPLAGPAPSVVVLVPCCDEEPEILRRSMSSIAHLRYPNASVWLVENSRKPDYKAQAEGIAAEYGVGVLHVRNRGNKGRALNDAMKMLHPPADYIAIFDADQKVQPDFLEKTVPILHADETLAFVQTAQVYENYDSTLVCRAAAQQEMLHYDTILEGKAVVGMAMCCGTNFVMRRRALDDVGGWDEESICEDMSTALRLHWNGWRSAYVRRAYSAGVGPMTLYAYWKQHRRWAIGGTM
ncbi:MAG: glycosyltransferase, partial [bacterium]|nr:glycosyltransferase [bacterium]